MRKAIPINNPSLPDESKTYIHVDIRVEIETDTQIDRVEPVFTHDQTDETFRTANLENFLGAPPEYTGEQTAFAEVEEGVYGWDDFRIRTVTQVGIQALEAAAIALSAGASHGEVSNPIQAETEAYPDVSLTALRIETTAGETIEVDVDERLPRVDDTCGTVGFAGLLNDGCSVEKLERAQSGVMVLSPATVAVEDSEGRVTGRIYEDGDYVVRDEIPDAVYSGAIRHEFVLAPEAADHLIVDGQADGEATVVTDVIDGGDVQTDVYESIAVDESTRVDGTTGGDSLTLYPDRGADATEEITPETTHQQAPEKLFKSRIRDDESESPATDADGGTSETEADGGISIASLSAGGGAAAGLLYLAKQIFDDEDIDDTTDEY